MSKCLNSISFDVHHEWVEVKNVFHVAPEGGPDFFDVSNCFEILETFECHLSSFSVGSLSHIVTTFGPKLPGFTCAPVWSKTVPGLGRGTDSLEFGLKPLGHHQNFLSMKGNATVEGDHRDILGPLMTSSCRNPEFPENPLACQCFFWFC